MHEMSLTQAILDIIRDYAQEHGFSQVHTLTLSFGRLSAIEPKALEFAFEVLAQGTSAESARIIFDIKPISILCMRCEAESILESYQAHCPQCQSPEVMLTGGKEELKLIEMDVD